MDKMMSQYRAMLLNGMQDLCQNKSTCARMSGDVDHYGWYYDAVSYALNNGLMKGTSETTFAPDSATTRAEAATILMRFIEGRKVAQSIKQTGEARLSRASFACKANIDQTGICEIGSVKDSDLTALYYGQREGIM